MNNPPGENQFVLHPILHPTVVSGIALHKASIGVNIVSIINLRLTSDNPVENKQYLVHILGLLWSCVGLGFFVFFEDPVRRHPQLCQLFNPIL